MSNNPSVLLELGQITEGEFEEIKQALKGLLIAKERVSSFYTLPENLEKIKQSIQTVTAQTNEPLLESITTLVKAQESNIILTADVVASSSRRLQ